jgi:PAS domain S-box-containing protein
MQDPRDEAALFASIGLSPIATVITNPRLPDNPVAAVNRAFERLTGYSAGEAVGRNCRFLGGPGTEAEATALLRKAIAEARPAMAEVTNYRRDGSMFRNAVMIAPIFDEAGALAYFVGSQMEVPEGGGGRRQIARERLASLTPRQRQVLRHMALGLRNKQIAAELAINEKTVKMHRAALLDRLGAATSADAVRLAVEGGL